MTPSGQSPPGAETVCDRTRPRTGNEKDVASIGHAGRITVAAIASQLIASLFQIPEAYWATIATLVVMQSSVWATLKISMARVVAAALGAFFGGVISACFGTNLIAFTVAIFLLGLCSIVLRLEKTAYHYAGITLTVIVLIPHVTSPWRSRTTEISAWF